MALIETEAVVLRTLRYGESDAILTLLTPGTGRVSAIAKGARKTTAAKGDPQYDATTSATPSAEDAHEQAPGTGE